MFFHVSKQQQENFPCQYRLGSFFVGTDAGWYQHSIGKFDIVYKGYLDSAPLESALETIVEQSDPMLTGNFCALVYDRNTKRLHVKSDRYRSFPIYFDDHATASYLTNLTAGPNVVYSNGLISVDDDFTVDYRTFDVVGSIDTNSTSTLDQIDQLLCNKIQQFAKHNRLPVRVFLSGGVDTLLLYSYLKRLNIVYELIWNTHCDIDEFYLANHADIYQNWGYRQIHHWTDPCVLVSGTPGDEFMLRGPVTANLYLLAHGTSIPELLAKALQGSQCEYLSLPKNLDIFSQQLWEYSSEKSLKETYQELCNANLNDWQHWHIGNTLTWTPLRDLDLFKLFLQLPLDQAKSQIFDSAVSRDLIERNVPGLSTALSPQKNTRNYMKNLKNLLP
jgi:hypothetical protein